MGREPPCAASPSWSPRSSPPWPWPAASPAARCLGFTHEPLEPGETVPYPGPEDRSPLPWNGTAWNGSAYEEVEPGNYTIEGAFPYRVDEGSETRTAEASVTVRVTR